MKRLRKMVLCIVGMALLVLGVGLSVRAVRVLWYCPSESREKSSTELQNNNYKCFKLSMLPTEHFSHGEIEFFTAMETQEVDYSFYNLRDLGDYLEEIYSTQEDVREIYIYLDPIEISAQYGKIAFLYGKEYTEQLLSVILAHPESVFGFVVPNYSAEYWSALEERETQEARKCIEDFLHQMELCENAKVFYLGFEEWLIGNRANYVDDRMHNVDVHLYLLAISFWSDEYVLTSENIVERFCLTEQSVQSVREREKVNLSEYDLIFVGDSIFGNYTDSLSVPGVLAGLTGARVYNCGSGGSSATDSEENELYFGNMVDFLLKGNIQDLEESVYKSGVQSYLEDNHENRKLCFCINYGLNDYFRGILVDDAENLFDTDSYGGALRSGIEKLQEAYPEAMLLLSGPNLITIYEGGTKRWGEQGGCLADYVECARKIAEEYGLLYVDTYNHVGYTQENADMYLADGCHPNPRGRYLFAQKFVEVLARACLKE